MSSQFWQATSTALGFCGTGGMIGVAAGAGILKSAPCTRPRLGNSIEEFLRMSREPVEQCVTIFGQSYSGPLADPYFQATMGGLIGVVIAWAIVAWQKNHP